MPSRAAPDDGSAPAESVRLVDVLLTTSGRRYVIERELEQDGYAALQALVNDYLAFAAQHGVIPVVYNPLDGNDG